MSQNKGHGLERVLIYFFIFFFLISICKPEVPQRHRVVGLGSFGINLKFVKSFNESDDSEESEDSEEPDESK